jgi:hypothetical protein
MDSYEVSPRDLVVFMQRLKQKRPSLIGALWDIIGGIAHWTWLASGSQVESIRPVNTQRLTSVLLATVLATCLLPFTAHAQANVNFAWDAQTPIPDGYEFTLTPTGTGTPFVFDCGHVTTATCQVKAIPAGSWSAVVRAYNLGVPATLKVYSGNSNAVPLTVPAAPAVPPNLKTGSATMSMDLRYDGANAPIYLGLIFTPKPVGK